MVRMQILLPTELHKKAKHLSKEKEISLADLIRKGLEIVIDGYSVHRKNEPWSPPILKNRKLKTSSPTKLKEIMNRDRR
jgi:hypothetical protein